MVWTVEKQTSLLGVQSKVPENKKSSDKTVNPLSRLNEDVAVVSFYGGGVLLDEILSNVVRYGDLGEL